MALRLDPVRRLIANDVDVGKTIEAGLIAYELLDRGVVPLAAGVARPRLEREADLPARQLARQLIQRQRRDLRDWLGEKTPFPERRSSEYTYQLDQNYRNLFDDVLAYCDESVAGGDEGVSTNDKTAPVKSMRNSTEPRSSTLQKMISRMTSFPRQRSTARRRA